MDRGRNLEALAEEDDEEEVDDERKKAGSSDESDSDDEEPDSAARREPNKFDNLCDGVSNAMALVHVALQELLNMKDEMLQHALPPTLLIKLATITGKVFRSVSDLNMPVNELVRLVRVYSTPWEEKSAALKKLHEDYESKQRQLNIAVKRLQLVDAHSKRIAREKRIMNWEKLFAKIMSNKGHGRRWKFLIETIKQKAKLGLEHVQEYTRALEESSDEEEEEEDEEMQMTLKRPGEDSDKLSDLEEGEEDASSGEKDSSEGVSKMEEEEEEDAEDKSRLQSPKKVRFASPTEPPAPVYVKPETTEAEVWTGEPQFDNFLFVRVFQPTKIEEKDLKCMIQYGDQIKKTKRLDPEEAPPEPEVEEPKPKGKGLIGSRAKPGEDKLAKFKKEAEARKAAIEAKISDNKESGTEQAGPDQSTESSTDAKSVEKSDEQAKPDTPVTTSKPDISDDAIDKPGTPLKLGKPDLPETSSTAEYEEMVFEIPEDFGTTHIWKPDKEKEPKSFKVSIHQGPVEEMFAMATIDIEDLLELQMKTVYLPEPHGDDDVPLSPGAEDHDSISEEVDLPLPGDDGKKSDELPKEKHHELKKVEPNHFPLFLLNPKKNQVHESCGMLPLLFYFGKRRIPTAFNRQSGTLPFNDLLFDVAGIDIETWKKEDMFKETESRAASAMEWQPEVQIKVVEKEVIKEVVVEKEVMVEPEIQEEIIIEKTPEPHEEMVKKEEYDKLVNKHSEELQLVQTEYEKRLQELMENLQQMQQAQLEQKQLMLQQQQQHQQLQQQRAAQGHQRPVSVTSSHKSSASGSRKSGKVGPKSSVQPSVVSPGLGVNDDVGMDPKTPLTQEPSSLSLDTGRERMHQFIPEPPIHKKNFRVGKPLPNWGTGIPENFLDRLQWFEEASKRHQEEVQRTTMKQIQDEIEKKLAGQHKLSKKEQEIYDAMKDVSLPALFMPTKNSTLYNPRAHQYFHPTGSKEVRLSQPPSMFQLPPLSHKSRMSVVNLFELSRNFNKKGQAWLMERYIQQQEPLANVHGMVPQTPAPTTAQNGPSGPDTMYDTQQSIQGTSNPERELEMEM